MPHAVKSLLICAVIHKEHAVGLVEILHRHRPEALLARCVPHQQLHVLAIKLHVLYLEVDADCRDMLGGEFIVGELVEKG